jgi:hypothetical protein
MIEKQYLPLPGQKPQKLGFTAEDIPILKEWYELKFPGPDMPAFSDLDSTCKKAFVGTLSFALYRCRYRWRELVDVINAELNKSITIIKNFFR